MAKPRSEFRNTRDYHIGVVARQSDNKFKGIAVAPDQSVWLDEDEQIATANAPREDGDNPFENGDLELLTPAKMIANRRRLGDTDLPQPDESSEAEADDAAGDGGGEPEPAPAGDGEESDDETPEAIAKREAEEAEAKAAAQVQEEKDRIEAAKVAQKAPEPQGRRNLSKEEQEESARNAAARAVGRQAPEETGAAPKPAGEAASGSRAATEEVATPGAVGK